MAIENCMFEEMGFSKNRHSLYEYTYDGLEFVIAYDNTVGYTMQCVKRDNGVVKFAKLGRHPYKEMVERIIDRVVRGVRA